jgi:hypothetical protein
LPIRLVKDSNVARDGSDKRISRITDERSRREDAVRPSESIPNGGSDLLTVCVTLGRLDYCVALALQQDGEQAALRERKGQS